MQVEVLAILEHVHRQVGPGRKAYGQFMREGLGAGHQAHFYEAVDQRFLGDERFLADLQRKATARHEAMVKSPPGSFDQVLQAVARVTSFSPDQLEEENRVWHEY